MVLLAISPGVTFCNINKLVDRTKCRSSLIYFACIGVAPPRRGMNGQRGATPMQEKWIKLDLNKMKAILLACEQSVLANMQIIRDYLQTLAYNASGEFQATLQELKLQGIKIRDGVVFSRYSRAQCFAINLSDFGKVLKCLCSSIGRV